MFKLARKGTCTLAQEKSVKGGGKSRQSKASGTKKKKKRKSPLFSEMGRSQTCRGKGEKTKEGGGGKDQGKCRKSAKRPNRSGGLGAGTHLGKGYWGRPKRRYANVKNKVTVRAKDEIDNIDEKTATRRARLEKRAHTKKEKGPG